MAARKKKKVVKKVELKLPTLLGRLKKAKDKADASGRIAAKDAEVFNDLKDQVIKKMQKEKLETAKAKGINISVAEYEQSVINVKDWKKFYAYIHKHKAFELLNKAVKSSSVIELLDSKKKVPGVVQESIPKLRVTIRS